MRLIVVVTCVLTTYVIGLVTGYNWPHPHLRLDNPVVIEQADIMRQLSQGLSTMVNCVDFKRQYPGARKRLLKRAKQTFVFSYSDTLDPSTAAATHALSGTLILTPTFFAEPDRSRVRILAHELMHIVGLPVHAHPLVIAKDPIYQLINACFPYDPIDID